MIAVHANVQTTTRRVQVFFPMRYTNNAPYSAIIPDVRAHLNLETQDWMHAEVVLMYYDRDGYNTRNKYLSIEKEGDEQ